MNWRAFAFVDEELRKEDQAWKKEFLMGPKR